MGWDEVGQEILFIKHSNFLGQDVDGTGVFNDRSGVTEAVSYSLEGTLREEKTETTTKNTKPMVASSTLTTSSSPSWSPSSLLVATAAILAWSFSEH